MRFWGFCGTDMVFSSAYYALCKYFSIVQVRFVKRMFLILNGDSFFMIKTDKKTDQTILTTLYFHLTEKKNKNKTKITKKLD